MFFCFLSFWYQANVKTTIVNPIKYGLNAATHKKEDASPLAPPSSANIGVMQQREAAAAVSSPAIQPLFFVVFVFKLYVFVFNAFKIFALAFVGMALALPLLVWL